MPAGAVNLYIITSSPCNSRKTSRVLPSAATPQDSDIFREDIDQFVKIAFRFDRLIDRLVVEAVVARMPERSSVQVMMSRPASLASCAHCEATMRSIEG